MRDRKTRPRRWPRDPVDDPGLQRRSSSGRPARRARRLGRDLVPVGAPGREDVDHDRALRAGPRLVRRASRDPPGAAGPRSFVSSPAVKLTEPSSTMPSCSLSCRCSGTTPSGSSSTIAMVIRSPCTMRAVTPSQTAFGSIVLSSPRLPIPTPCGSIAAALTASARRLKRCRFLSSTASTATPKPSKGDEHGRGPRPAGYIPGL